MVTSPRSAHNGLLLRLAPVAIRFWNHRTALVDVAVVTRQSKSTHATRPIGAFREMAQSAVACAR